MTKLKNLTQKQLRALIAILVAVAVIVPSMAVFIVKGAERKTHFTELETSQGAETSLVNTYEGGTVYYHHQNDDRTYTYDLGNTKLVPGDTIRFDDTNQKIYWTHSTAAAAEAAGYTNVCADTDPLMRSESTDNDTYVLALNESKSLNSGTTYYYTAPNGNTYTFEVDGFVGYEKSDKSTATDNSTRDYYLKDDPLKAGVDVKITIDDSGSEPETTYPKATFSGYQMTRHVVYLQKTDAKDASQNKIYLVGADAANNTSTIVTYSDTGASTNKLFDRNRGLGSPDCQYRTQLMGSDKYHTEYAITPQIVSLNTTGGIFNLSGTEYSDYYIDGSTNSFLNAEFLSETVDTNYFYLKGNNGAKYTTEKAFGKAVGIDQSGNKYLWAYVYDMCDQESHNQAVMWTSNGSKMTIRKSYYGTSNTTLYYDASPNASAPFTFAPATTSTIRLYEMTAAYDKAAVNVTIPTPSRDIGSTGELEATDISYTENSVVAGNNLEIDKTVSLVDKDEGIYDITLEAYTTSATLKQPATDIMLLLDSSKNMTNVLYSRNYRSLNTYASFKEKALKDVQYNDLHDTDNPSNTSLINVWNTYSNNKYVSDPNTPGVYLYLSTTYRIGSLSYQFSFTDNYGNVYQTSQISPGATGLHDIDDGLDFTLVTVAPGHSASEFVSSKHYDTFFYRSDVSTENPALNINLYKYSREGGGPGLYYLDEQGNPYEVSVHRTTKRVERGWWPHQEVDLNTRYEYSVTVNGTTYTAVQANEKYGADYGVFQGFRYYRYKDGKIVLDDNKSSLMSKNLYVKENEDVTALQAMKESLEHFLLNAHSQVVGKGAEVYVGLVAYDKGSEVKYSLKNDNSGNGYTDLSKPVGDNSIDSMISEIFNYVVEEYYDGNEYHMYNVISDNAPSEGAWRLTRFKGTYAAEIDSGMTRTKDQLANHNHDGIDEATGETVKSRKFAVLFTAGVPSAYTTNIFGSDNSGTFTTSTASSAISTAYDIKNSLDTTFYSVGLFDNANETKINGDYWYYQTFGDKVKCDGKAGSYWGGSWVSNLYNMDPKDAYATNRMLAYISSDYKTPRTLGLTRGSYHPGRTGLWGWVSSGTGYRIDQNFSREDTGYYMTVSPNTLNEDAIDEDHSASEAQNVDAILSAVFEQLAVATASPKNELDADSFLVDGITDYFDLVLDDPDHLPTAQVFEEDGETLDSTLTAQLKARYDRDLKPSEEGWATAATNTKTIDVSGFDYKSNWIGTGNEGNGRKLVLTFRVKRTDGLIGGNSIPTNLSKTAIYDGDEDVVSDDFPWGLMEERYEIPKVDLPIKMTKFTQNDSIYYGGTKNLDALLDISELNEREIIYRNSSKGSLIPNEFVTIKYDYKTGADPNAINIYTIPAGATSGTWAYPIQEAPNNDGTPGAVHTDNLSKIFVQPDESTTYKVDVVINPTTKGTIKADTSNTNKEANVYVFTPHYTTYNGTVEKYTDEYNLTSTSEKTPMLTEWKYDEKLELEEGFDPATLLDKSELPSVTFDLNKYDHPNMEANKKGSLKDTFTVSNNNVTQAVESTDGNLDAYVVGEKHDLIMNNIQVTAAGRDYAVEQVVQNEYYDTIGVIWKIEYLDENDPTRVTKTEYYDKDGNPVQTEAEATTRASYEDESGNPQTATIDNTPTPIYGIVTKSYAPSKNADEKTTAENASDHREQVQDGKPGKSFTLSLNSHDVTIHNETKAHAGESDYSDPKHEFPLTITLKDGSNVAPNETITYELTDGKTGAKTTGSKTTDANGQFVIELKHNDTIVLQQVPDEYVVTVTSDTSDHYDVAYKSKVGNEAEKTHTVDITKEASEAITISDDTSINVTHTIRSVPTTGMGDENIKLNPFFIAAAIVALLGGTGTGYMVKRKKETEA